MLVFVFALPPFFLFCFVQHTKVRLGATGSRHASIQTTYIHTANTSAEQGGQIAGQERPEHAGGVNGDGVNILGFR